MINKNRNICGIYCIKNTLDNKVYVGQAVKIQFRWSRHKSDLNLKKHPSPHLQNAWNKYGFKVFEFIILEELERNKDILKEREQYWMDYYKSYDKEFGYNVGKIAGSRLGVLATEETKKKLRQRKARIWTEESRKKLSESKKGVKRKPFSEEHKAKLREILKNNRADNTGRIQTEEHRRKNSEANKGRKGWNGGLTKETDLRVAKISSSNTGKPKIFSPEHLERLRIRLQKRNKLGKGKKLSLEHRQNIGKGLKKYYKKDANSTNL